MRGRKGSQYDGGHRVPCFIRWPEGGLAGGRDVRPIAAHIDLLPTLIELCRLRQPVGLEFDGASLGPLLHGHATGWPDRTLFVDVQRVDRPIKWRRSAVMTDRWRLIDGEQLYDMKADPGQQHDVADAHPDVVKKLRAAYERWWADISTRFHEDCAIPIGADEAPLARLTGHDWHGERVPWAQHTVRRAMKANGFWVIEVVRDGTYEISLRRWPIEVDQPINAGMPEGDAINATVARLKIADMDVTSPVAQDATEVTFTVALRAGQTRLQTWLTDDSGVSRGAYYVYVRRLR
jgi:arylsulfatase B